ncbi:MAG TPA: LysR family transcriptional regulator [Solirubrobacteraceae bacterium]
MSPVRSLQAVPALQAPEALVDEDQDVAVAIEDVASSIGAVDLRLLRYFVTVAEELHFGGAARRLNIAQPALSSAVKMLEARLGVALLRRTTRRVELTRAGEVLLSSARRLLEAHAGLLYEMAAQRRAEAGEVRLGYAGSFTGVLPAGAARAVADSSGACFELHDVGPGSGIEPLLARRVDALLLTAPLEDVPGLSSTLLGFTARVLAIPASHQAARTMGTQAIGSWGEAQIAIEGMPRAWSEVWSPQSFFSQDPIERAPTLESALELVAAGRGATMAPALAADRCARPDVVYLPVSGQSRVGVYLVRRREDSCAKALSALSSSIRATLSQGAQVHPFDDLDWLALIATEVP